MLKQASLMHIPVCLNKTAPKTIAWSSSDMDQLGSLWCHLRSHEYCWCNWKWQTRDRLRSRCKDQFPQDDGGGHSIDISMYCMLNDNGLVTGRTTLSVCLWYRRIQRKISWATAEWPSLNYLYCVNLSSQRKCYVRPWWYLINESVVNCLTLPQRP